MLPLTALLRTINCQINPALLELIHIPFTFNFLAGRGKRVPLRKTHTLRSCSIKVETAQNVLRSPFHELRRALSKWILPFFILFLTLFF